MGDSGNLIFKDGWHELGDCKKVDKENNGWFACLLYLGDFGELSDLVDLGDSDL